MFKALCLHNTKHLKRVAGRMVEGEDSGHSGLGGDFGLAFPELNCLGRTDFCE